MSDFRLNTKLSRNLRDDKTRREQEAYSKEQLEKTRIIAEAVVRGIMPAISVLAKQNEVSKEMVIQALKEVNINTPEANVRIDNPPIEVKIPEIKVPEAKVTVEMPKMPKIDTPIIPPIKVPKPEVTVNIPTIKVPKIDAPEVSVNVDKVKLDIDRNNPMPTIMMGADGKPMVFPQAGAKGAGGVSKAGLNIPEFDYAELTETPETDFWTFKKGNGSSGNIVSTVYIVYSDDTRGTISSVAKGI